MINLRSMCGITVAACALTTNAYCAPLSVKITHVEIMPAGVASGFESPDSADVLAGQQTAPQPTLKQPTSKTRKRTLHVVKVILIVSAIFVGSAVLIGLATKT